MKIGIITYHRSHNYGALLQAVATRVFLERRGHNVFYLDYWPSYHKQYYAFFSVSEMLRRGLKNGLEYFIDTLKYGKSKRKRIAAFNKFISSYIQPYCVNENERCDVIVCGSDQIWRKQSAIRSYNPSYWGVGDFHANMKISYAASMGILPNNDIDKKILKSYLENLDNISVREEDLKQLVRMLGFECEVNIDPTLMLKKDDWDALFGFTDGLRNERYALFYDLQKASFDVDEINRFVKGKGLSLKIICGNPNKSDTDNIMATADPVNFVRLIKDAEFVFTSSFHGLVFSIIYNKPFYASFRANSGRAESLLKILNLIDRLLPPLSAIPLEQKTVNFKHVNQILDGLRQNSVKYFEKLNL